MKDKEYKITKIRFVLILIALIIGIILCLDLSYIFYKTNYLSDYAPSFCTISDLIDCDGLANTHFSLTFGVPNALWGMFVYLIFLMLLFVDKINEKFPNTIFNVFKHPRSYMATIGLLTFCASLTLAFVSYNELHKICVVCICTYFVDLFIALVARTKGFFVHDIIVTVLDFIDGAKKHFILFLLAVTAFVSTLYYLNDTLIFSPRLRKQVSQREFFEAKTNKYAVKGNILGNENAPVVINVYSDFNCPFCRVVNTMVHKLAKHHRVLVNEIAFPLDKSCNYDIHATLGGHETSCLGARYAIAAKKQNKFWAVANHLFYNTYANEEDMIIGLKKAHLGLNIEKLTSDANSEESFKEVQQEIQLAKRRGITATPSFEINGVLYVGAMPYDELAQKVDLAEKRTKNK